MGLSVVAKGLGSLDSTARVEKCSLWVVRRESGDSLYFVLSSTLLSFCSISFYFLLTAHFKIYMTCIYSVPSTKGWMDGGKILSLGSTPKRNTRLFLQGLLIFFCVGIEHLLTKLGKALERPEQDGHTTSVPSEAKSLTAAIGIHFSDLCAIHLNLFLH